VQCVLVPELVAGAWLPDDGVVVVLVVVAVGVPVVEAVAAWATAATAPPVAMPAASKNAPAKRRIMDSSFLVLVLCL
jgi:hypothetical protein